jgi:sentrin-specific protease 1
MQGVRRWSKRARLDVFAVELIFVPINHNQTHWCMACINVAERRFEYYDSMGGQGHNVLEVLRRYMEDESRTHRGLSVDLSDWAYFTPQPVPQQQNGSDCGVFTIEFAECRSRRAALTFSQRDMPFFRRKIALDIARGAL